MWYSDIISNCKERTIENQWEISQAGMSSTREWDRQKKDGNSRTY